MVLLDLRDTADFKSSHIRGSHNLEVGDAVRPNPYKDTATLKILFDILSERLGTSDPLYGAALDDKLVLLISHDGNIARLASSILRNRGVKAHYVIGGVNGWRASGLWSGVTRNLEGQPEPERARL
jgi:rhodanese-related sulfurtransferase